MLKKQKVIHRLIWYVLIFSIVGLIIETIYGYLTTGILESRKGLILGPFCPIYGVGAAILLILLDNIKENKIKLFLYGALCGTIFEYICSYVMQVMYGSRFWDYSYTTFHINGRVSLTYTFFWGVLSVILVGYVKVMLDKAIDKIPYKIWDKAIIYFLIFDVVITVIGISTYMKRVEYKYNRIYKEEKILDHIFNDKIMSTIFPNLRYMDQNGKEIYAVEIIKKDRKEIKK